LIHWLRILLAFLLVGCGSSSNPASSVTPNDAGATGAADDARSPPPAAALSCDGGTDIRLAFGVLAAGQISPEEELASRNGWRYLFVSGACDYWVNAIPTHGTPPSVTSAALLQEARTGRLTASDFSQMLQDVRHDTWSALAGPPQRNIIHDGPLRLVTDNHYVVQCIATCEEELGGPSTDPPALPFWKRPNSGSIAWPRWANPSAALYASSPHPGPEIPTTMPAPVLGPFKTPRSKTSPPPVRTGPRASWCRLPTRTS
jgi:hypothetical protein